MDADFLFPSIYVPSTCTAALAGLARRQPTRDTGRTAAGRAGSFNSGKNQNFKTGNCDLGGRNRMGTHITWLIEHRPAVTVPVP